MSLRSSVRNLLAAAFIAAPMLALPAAQAVEAFLGRLKQEREA